MARVDSGNTGVADREHECEVELRTILATTAAIPTMGDGAKLLLLEVAAWFTGLVTR